MVIFIGQTSSVIQGCFDSDSDSDFDFDDEPIIDQSPIVCKMSCADCLMSRDNYLPNLNIYFLNLNTPSLE